MTPRSLATALARRRARPPAPPGRAMGLAEAIFDHLHRRGAFMVVQVVLLDGRLEHEALLEALRALQRRHPLLGCHIAEPGVFAPGADEIELERLPRRDGDHWKEVAEQQAHRPLPLGRKPQVRITWLADDAADRTELVIASNHALLDGVSAATLLRELLEDSTALGQGRRPAARSPLPLLPPIEAILRPARSSWPSWRAPACLTADASAPARARRSRFAFGELEAPRTAALAGRAKQRGTSMHGAICAAMLLALRDDAPHERRLTLATNVSLRPETSPPVGDEHLGSYVSALITDHVVGPQTRLWDLAREVKTELARRHAAGEHILRLRGELGVIGRTALDLAPRIGNGRWQALNVSNPGRPNLPTSYPGVALRAYYGFAGQPVVGADVQLCTMTIGGSLGYTLQHVEPLMSADRAARVEARLLRALSLAGETDDEVTAAGLAA